MPRIAWSFAEPVPTSVEDLTSRLDAYAKTINRKLHRRELQRVFPGKRIDIEYEYRVRRSDSVPWETLTVVTRVEERGAPLTYADILLQLHQAAHKHLKDEDRTLAANSALVNDACASALRASFRQRER